MIELKSVQQIIQLPVLASLFELHVVLLETVESEFRLIVDEDFEGLECEKLRRHTTRDKKGAYAGHELFARLPDGLRQCGAEHHHLLVVGCCTENFLNVAAHV